MKLKAIYRNGNYRVRLYDDGTKIRETITPEENEFVSEFPESIDLKITNKCDLNCPMCHEDSNIDGLHGDINMDFIKTIPEYTEIAIGGGNPLEHPRLLELLHYFKQHNIIANITFNQLHFMKNLLVIDILIKNNLINGIGISYDHFDINFIHELKNRKNVVLHVIAGLISLDDLIKLKDKGLKILILGYKDFRRGSKLYTNEFYKDKINNSLHELKMSLTDVYEWFDIVSFDNLAIKQLLVKNTMNNFQWEEFYQGDDGSHTFYIDLVNKQFAKNSTSLERYDLLSDVTEMFKKLKIM